MRKRFIFLLIYSFFVMSPILCQAATIILTNASPNAIISASENTTVYGTAAANTVTIESTAHAELINFPGSNTITIESNSNLFTVSRSGATVTFEGTDETILKLPATTTVQTIDFTDLSYDLVINAGSVYLGEQVVTLTPVLLSGAHSVCGSNNLYLCTTSTECIEADGYWWSDNTCNRILELLDSGLYLKSSEIQINTAYNVNTIIYFYYNENGDVLSEDYDEGRDRTIDFTTTYNYAYGTDGKILSSTKTYLGVNIETTDYTYYDSGKVKTKANPSSTLTYDENGNMLSRHSHYSDGWDYIELWTYNIFNDELSYQSDWDFMSYKYDYNEDALPITKTITRYVINDGVQDLQPQPDTVYYYFYDDKLNLIKEERYDESFKLLDYYLYTYDDYGNRLSSEYYYNDAPIGESSLAYYYTWVLQYQ